MSTKLTLKNSFQLTLNPVLHTFIGFLPLNRVEFVNKIKNEVESNPMLEMNFQPGPEQQKNDQTPSDIESKLERADKSFLNTYEEQGFLKRSSDSIDKNRAIELFTASDITLSDHLVEQAKSQFTQKEFEIANHIIYNLNPHGYLDVEILSIASAINSTPEEIERIRKIIMTFDPQGIASQTLQECLLSQVPDTPENKNIRIIITDHLEDLSKKRYHLILTKLNISHEELEELIQHLKRLNPRPGDLFEHENIDYAEVDLMLFKEHNEYKVKFIDDGIPRIQLSTYYDQMYNKAHDKKTRSYLKQKHRSANMFIEGIELRKSIIVKIAEFLVKRQRDFLEFGEKWKKPLTMKEVAKELNYNESTISRAVSNKFIATEKGLISIRSFFSYGIKGEFGLNYSVETVKDKIKKIIDEEKKLHPLSDQDVADKLNNLGIKISRRTIRNYRNEMHIPSSSRRKEESKLKSNSTV